MAMRSKHRYERRKLLHQISLILLYSPIKIIYRMTLIIIVTASLDPMQHKGY